MGGKEVHKLTAVFAPDLSKLSGEVDILLWFHGDKHYWSKRPKVDQYFKGKSIHYYLNEPVLALTKLREFILKSSKKRFVLVAPTLNDNTGSGPKHTAGGLLWQQADAEAYLQQVLNGVKKHLGVSVTVPGNIVLAAHSGGGHLQTHIAGNFTGLFDKMNEVWCFDSTYWGYESFEAWAQKGHSNNPRLFVYSTGGAGKKDTGDSAEQILTDSLPKPAAKPKRGAPPPPRRRTLWGRRKSTYVWTGVARTERCYLPSTLKPPITETPAATTSPLRSISRRWSRLPGI
jgi:hypothetical protein